jgi:hypothetical protein
MMGVPWHHGDEILSLTTLMLGGMDPQIRQGIDNPFQSYGAAASRMVAIVEEIALQRREAQRGSDLGPRARLRRR